MAAPSSTATGGAAPAVVHVNGPAAFAAGKPQLISTEQGTVTVTPLGSGGEVGRSCILVSVRNKCVMLDCGIHPAKAGLDALPIFDAVDLKAVDLCLVTHFHLDHCGGLPYLCEQTGFRGRVVMTHPTKSFYKMVMADFLRIGAGAQDIVTMEWLHATVDRVETVEYHQELRMNGIRAVALNAGHVLGAAMFLVDICGVRILYTGDYSRVPDRHLLGAELPPLSPDVLIVESTYGIQVHETREERETKFTTWVHNIVKRGGRCLIPVFALGRAQELLLILEEYWAEHKDIQHVPIHYASSLAQRCMNLYRTYGSAMNDRVRRQLDNNTNPFDFKFITSLKDLSSFDDSGPSVVLASPGMLQSGVSLELFERWCGDKRNGIIIAGYCVDGTIAKQVLRKPKEIVKDDGTVLNIRMEDVHAVSFSAHSDAKQTCEFISHLKGTKHVVLVHGNEDSGNKLQKRLTDEFVDRGMKVFTTRNTTPIHMAFTAKRTATLVGSIAAEGAALRQTTIAKARAARDEGGATSDSAIYTSDSALEGVLLVGADHRCTLVAADELGDFSDIQVASLRHATVLPLVIFTSTDDIVRHLRSHFSSCELLPDVVKNVQPEVTHKRSRPEEQPDGDAAGADDAGARDPTADPDEQDDDGEAKHTGLRYIDVSGGVRVKVLQTTDGRTAMTVIWRAARYADLVADVTTAALLGLIESQAATHGPAGNGPRAAAGTAAAINVAAMDAAFRRKCFQRMLAQHFDSVRVSLANGDTVCCVSWMGNGSASAGANDPTHSAWIHIRDGIEVRVLREAPASADDLSVPLDASRLADSTAIPAERKRRIAATLRRLYLALNPVPGELEAGADSTTALADFIDQGGWCGCGSHDDQA